MARYLVLLIQLTKVFQFSGEHITNCHPDHIHVVGLEAFMFLHKDPEVLTTNYKEVRHLTNKF